MVVVVVMVGGCSAVSLTTAYEGKRMIGGIGHVLLSTYSQKEKGEDPLVSLVDLWGQVITTWTNLGKQKFDGDPPFPSPSPAPSPSPCTPCVRPKNLRV